LALPPEIKLLNHIRKHTDMIDWNLVAKIAGGGFGVTILVLVILSLVAWVVGLVIQKTRETTTESEDNSGKG